MYAHRDVRAAPVDRPRADRRPTPPAADRRVADGPFGSTEPDDDRGPRATVPPSPDQVHRAGLAAGRRPGRRGGPGHAGWRICHAEGRHAHHARRRSPGWPRRQRRRAQATADYLRTALAAEHRPGRDASAPSTPTGASRPQRAVLRRYDADLDAGERPGHAVRPDRRRPGAVTGLHEVAAGELGGMMKCGATPSRRRRHAGVRLGRPRQRGARDVPRPHRGRRRRPCCARSAAASRRPARLAMPAISERPPVDGGHVGVLGKCSRRPTPYGVGHY